MRGLVLLFLVATIATGIRAETMTVSPDDCPVEADAPVYFGEDVEAEDLNPWRETANDFAPLIDRNVADHPGADRIFIRLSAHPEAGETLAPPLRLCGEEP